MRATTSLVLDDVVKRTSEIYFTPPDKLQLTEQERQLVTLRDEIYEGSWKRMITDLLRRSNDRPYNHRIVVNCMVDMKLAQFLMDYEERHKINFSEPTKTS